MKQLSDESLLQFIAQHELVTHLHVVGELGEEAEAADALKRLSSLAAEGLVINCRWSRETAGCWRITEAGLDRIGGALPVPLIDPRRYRHEVGVVWVWMLAHRGRFGELETVLSRRAMQHDDRTIADRGSAGGEIADDVQRTSFALRESQLDGELHYPDVLRVSLWGRTALEFFLTVPAPEKLDRLLRAYEASATIERVCLMAPHAAIADALHRGRTRVGGSKELHVLPATPPEYV